MIEETETGGLVLVLVMLVVLRGGYGYAVA